MKRSTGPAASNPYNQLKRSSLGGKNGAVPVPPLPVGVRGDRPMSYTSSQSGSSSPSEAKELPNLPVAENLHANVTVRPSSRIPSNATTSILSKSRIGRPSGGGISGRRSGGGESNNVLDIKDLQPRSGSPSAAK